MEVAMATRLQTDAELYERDLGAWARRQAELLRARRFDELDLERLILEVEDLGGADYRSVRSRLRTIIEHLLKLQHSPAQAPRRGWHDSIINQRGGLRQDLTPTIRRRVRGELAPIYRRARADAATGLRYYGEDAAADALPETCPYSFEQITGDWLP
jgi:hypothetical protein